MTNERTERIAQRIAAEYPEEAQPGKVSMPAVVTIRNLQMRVLAYARQCVAAGLITETRLASQAGMSQPHMANILCGRRGCSAETADALIRTLNISALDLYTVTELREIIEHSVQIARARIHQDLESAEYERTHGTSER